MMGLGIVYPLGAVLQGLAANHVGVRTVTVVGAGALLVVLGGIAAFARGSLRPSATLLPTRCPRWPSAPSTADDPMSRVTR